MDLNRWTNLEGSYVGTSNDTAEQMAPGIYDMTVFNGQVIFVPVDERDDVLLRFPGTPSDDILTEIETFWTREQKFRDHGFPYKRGILMHGPPGSGKSCTMRLIAEDVVARGGIVLVYGDPNVFIAAYRIFRMIQPETPLVVIMEDLDSILDRANETKVLNLLDGIESVDRVVFLASTNYPEKLGPRVANRPSRFDRKFLVGHPNLPGRKLYLQTLVQDSDVDIVDVERWAKDTEGFSIAHLKELFVAVAILGTTYHDAMATLRGMKERATSEDGDPLGDTGQYI